MKNDSNAMPFRDIDAIIFDAGGVLFLPADDRFAEVAEKLNTPYSPGSGPKALAKTVWDGALSADPKKFWDGNAKISRMCQYLGFDMCDGQFFWRELVRPTAAHANLWSESPCNLIPTLMHLRRDGYLLGVISNNDGSLDRMLTQAGIKNLFDVVVDSYHAGVEKPAKEIFLQASNGLKVPLDRCMFVGDDPYFDIGGSAAAGVARQILVDRFGLRPKTWGSAAIACVCELQS